MEGTGNNDVEGKGYNDLSVVSGRTVDARLTEMNSADDNDKMGKCIYVGKIYTV